ncbi:hypothetical protein TNCV_232871 [Trichonephila clavipes]|nr:hypothetical protein TNCV_232871 [Trichonephila clavipes]
MGSVRQVIKLLVYLQLLITICTFGHKLFKLLSISILQSLFYVKKEPNTAFLSTNCSFTLLGWWWLLLTPRITHEVPAYRYGSLPLDFSRPSVVSVMSDEKTIYGLGKHYNSHDYEFVIDVVEVASCVELLVVPLKTPGVVQRQMHIQSDEAQSSDVNSGQGNGLVAGVS